MALADDVYVSDDRDRLSAALSRTVDTEDIRCDHCDGYYSRCHITEYRYDVEQPSGDADKVEHQCLIHVMGRKAICRISHKHRNKEAYPCDV